MDIQYTVQYILVQYKLCACNTIYGYAYYALVTRTTHITVGITNTYVQYTVYSTRSVK